ncbi:hypothetical protein OG948_56805 (plasmid) [Embleya sp. NBC_00888]|uniref:hypothetical protein n=1 Tax=Embleya sp. NBC_00888 TaxID=2975960 RepID=UPI002F9170EA|nr:hypothetical protein OG948_56805 [Embleya sp. NBC_00888]
MYRNTRFILECGASESPIQERGTRNHGGGPDQRGTGGKTGRIAVVGYDACAQEVTHLRAGNLTALVSQNPYTIGQLAVQNTVKYLDRDRSIPKGRPFDPVVVTKDNLNDPAIQKHAVQVADAAGRPADARGPTPGSARGSRPCSESSPGSLRGDGQPGRRAGDGVADALEHHSGQCSVEST